jgi:hypothetical protein
MHLIIMANEWAPVVSDGIKIGLGAIVGGFFALINAINSQRLKTSEEFTNHRRQGIQEIVQEFDHLALAIRSRASSLTGFYESGGDRRDLYSEMESELAKAWSATQILQRLHSIGSKLLMFSLTRVAAAVEAYRDLYCRLDAEEDQPAESATRFADSAKSLEVARKNIMEGLATAYCGKWKP